MERVPSPRDLRSAGAVAQSLAYVAGLAGVVAGALLYRDGDVAFGVVVWVLTFAFGAVLMISAFVVRSMAAVLGHLAAIESDLKVLLADAARQRELTPDRPWPPHQDDPWADPH